MSCDRWIVSQVAGRNSQKTYDTDLALTGITDEKIDVYSQAQDYTDRPTLLAWLTYLFLPEVMRRRQDMGY
jgi:hypothetical protein